MDAAYLGYVLRTVPPAAVARAAARRVLRTTRRDGVIAPSTRQLLAAAGVRSVAQLPSVLARPAPGPLALLSPAGVAGAAALLRSRLPSEARDAVDRAEGALAGRIDVFGASCELPRADRTVPRATPGYVAIDWERDPLPGRPHDVRRPWVVGRLAEVVHLACGAVLVPERRRSRRFADEALDRILDVASAPRGVQWTCAMEVSLRALDVALALRLLAGHPALERRPAAVAAALSSLVLHARHVEANLEDLGVVANNHLVGDLVGMLAVGALLPPLASLVAAPAAVATRLASELLAQTLPDGLSFEGSVPYHRLALELFALGHLLSSACGAPFPPAAVERLSRMFAATRELLDGRGLCPQIGDCDSQQALPFRPRGPQEQAHLLPLGAALLGRDDLGPASARGVPEVVWLLGRLGVARLPRPTRAPRPADSALRHGGVYVLRSERLSCAVAAGPNGTGGTGVHGHNDKLSAEICVDGRLAVADPGSYCYTGEPAERNRFRGTAAHSTVVVDGEEQQELPAGRLFALPDRARTRCLAFESTRERGRFVGEHRGYARLPGGPVHRRELVLDRRRELILVEDVLAGGGSHRVELRWLLAVEEARLRPLPAPLRRRLERAAPAWRGFDLARALELGPPRRPLAFIVCAGAAGPPELLPAAYAPGYGQKVPALSACFHAAGELPLALRAAVLAP